MACCESVLARPVPVRGCPQLRRLPGLDQPADGPLPTRGRGGLRAPLKASEDLLPSDPAAGSRPGGAAAQGAHRAGRAPGATRTHTERILRRCHPSHLAPTSDYGYAAGPSRRLQPHGLLHFASRMMSRPTARHRVSTSGSRLGVFRDNVWFRCPPRRLERAAAAHQPRRSCRHVGGPPTCQTLVPAGRGPDLDADGPVVVRQVGGERAVQVPIVPDQQPVQALGPYGAHPPLGERVREASAAGSSGPPPRRRQTPRRSKP